MVAPAPTGTQHQVATSWRWGEAVTLHWLSTSSNYLLMVLEVLYNIFYNSSAGGTLILPMLSPIGTGPKCLVA